MVTSSQNSPGAIEHGDSDFIAFLNDVPVLAAKLGADCRYQQANRTYVEMFGLSQADIVGRHVADVLTQAGWETVKPFIDTALTGASVSYEAVLPFKKGMRYAQVNYTPRLNSSGAVIGFFVVALDVHEVVLAQRAAAQRAHDLKLVLDHLPAMVVSFDRNKRYLSLNRGYREALNLGSEQELRGRSIREVVGEVVWSAIESRIDQVLTGQTVCFDAVLPFSGEMRHVNVSYVPESSDPVQCDRFFALIIDREKEYIDALATRQSEEQLRTTLNCIGDAVISTDTLGNVARMNYVAERLTGWRQVEATGRHITEVLHIVHETDRCPVVNPVDTVMQTRRVVGLANHTVLIARGGEEYQIADSAAPILSEAGELQGVVMVFRDVTHEHQLQSQLRQSEKLQAIGQLAGGIAHDFNNLLGGALGAAQLIALRAGDKLDLQSRGFLQMIQATALRASDLTEKLTAFARKANYTFARTDIDVVVQDSIKILRHTIDKKIAITVRSDGAAHVVHGNAAALQSALLNIGINAWHAMPQGGEIKISLSRRLLTDVGAEWASFKLQPGWFVSIDFADTGIGIAPEHLSKVFEPFFTTKAPGTGTGLGLAAVYGTVLDHLGAVLVQSDVGRGSVFRLLLPETVAPAEPTVPVPPVAVERARRTVLLVDDEAMLLDVLQCMLETLGYTVIAARDGRSAVEIYRNQHQSIDLVITDMNLPVMNGAEVIAHVRSIRPDCRILVSTGFSESNIIGEVDRLGVSGVIRKPYTMEILGNALVKAFS